MHSYPAYIGLDVHEETIAVAVARAGREGRESRGEIANKPKTVAKLVERLNRELLFGYEADPCGYSFWSGSRWSGGAPSLIPKKPDRRDACKVSQTLRNGI